MVVFRYLLRSSAFPKSSLSQTLRLVSTTRTPSTNAPTTLSSSSPSHHKAHSQTHAFQPPNAFVGSWAPPSDPSEAASRLALLRRQYAKQVKQLRHQYILEVEQRRLDQQRKDDAKREAARLANEQRKAAKAAEAQAKAVERKAADEEFRQTLLKERAEKLENWRMKEKLREEKKKEKNELLRRQSSMWINESELERKVLEVTVGGTPL